MMDEKQKAFIFGMRNILKRRKTPIDDIRMKMIDTIIDGFGIIDDMTVEEIEKVTTNIK